MGLSMPYLAAENEGRRYRTEKMNIQDMSGWNNGYRHQPSDYDEDPKYCQEDAVTYGGNVGDLIIVHTDILHYGSIILEQNKQRKVVLLHCRPQ
jgi:diadenosine tetraphosphatase ApaH/serine/threonine PP2A family protein phosphatase